MNGHFDLCLFMSTSYCVTWSPIYPTLLMFFYTRITMDIVFSCIAQVCGTRVLSRYVIFWLLSFSVMVIYTVLLYKRKKNIQFPNATPVSSKMLLLRWRSRRWFCSIVDDISKMLVYLTLRNPVGISPTSASAIVYTKLNQWTQYRIWTGLCANE